MVIDQETLIETGEVEIKIWGNVEMQIFIYKKRGIKKCKSQAWINANLRHEEIQIWGMKKCKYEAWKNANLAARLAKAASHPLQDQWK